MECEHIIGTYNNINITFKELCDCFYQEMEELRDYYKWNKSTRQQARDYLRMRKAFYERWQKMLDRRSGGMYHFIACPLCGEKLKWKDLRGDFAGVVKQYESKMPKTK